VALSGPVSASGEGRRPVRVLTVGNMYPPQHTGGYELMWQAAVRRARSLGHEVRVLTSDARLGRDEREADPDVHRTLRWYWDIERYRFNDLGPLGRLQLERQNARELNRHLREFEPDVVSWWSMGCMSLSLIELARRREIPAVSVVHDDWLVYGQEHDHWSRMWRKRPRLAPVVARCLRMPTIVDAANGGRFVFNSRYTLEAARRAGASPSSARVVYPGVEDRFLTALPATPWGWRLLYVGRIDRQKGVDTAVHALRHLPSEATLTAYGTGDDDYIAEMKALAFDFGLSDRVQFAGWAGDDEILSAYGAADAVVFPSRWEEPFGLVPIEAMGLGRPVVATARGGSAEFLRDGENALVFEADDAEGLAGAVTRLAEDAALRERLLRGGRETASGYSLARFADETVREIVGAARP
jgi:glycosyltransferase involved in cell wall biosynthesis